MIVVGERKGKERKGMNERRGKVRREVKIKGRGSGFIDILDWGKSTAAVSRCFSSSSSYSPLPVPLSHDQGVIHSTMTVHFASSMDVTLVCPGKVRNPPASPLEIPRHSSGLSPFLRWDAALHLRLRLPIPHQRPTTTAPILRSRSSRRRPLPLTQFLWELDLA